MLIAPTQSGPSGLRLVSVGLFILAGGFGLVFSLFPFGVNTVAIAVLPFP